MKLIIKKDLKYRIKVEEYKKFESSFLSEVYSKAWNIFKEILNNAKSQENKNNLDDYEVNNENRMIAFVGDRGTGKTSAMYSFADALLSQDYLNSKDEKIGKISFEKVNIDPSLFEDHENILEIVIAELFKNFKASLENSNMKDNYHDKRNLLSLFEDVYKNIKTIEKRQKFIDNDDLVEQISNLASSSKLKINFKKLFTEYLNFKFSKDNNQYKFILLIIDDFDLNVKQGYEMSEQIRKYLLYLPNVIVLSSLNFNDLQSLIDKGNIETLKDLLKNKFIQNNDIYLKSSRYLEKLIPYPRRIFLPEVQRDKNIINLDLNLAEEKEILKLMVKSLITQVFLQKSFSNSNSMTRDEIVKSKDEFYDQVCKSIDSFESLSELRKNLSNKFLQNIEDYKKSFTYDFKEEEILALKQLNEIISIKLEEKVLRLIEVKTGLIFFQTSGRSATLIPETLRELRSLVFFLYALKANDFVNNTNEFKKYISENLVKQNV